MRDLLLLIFGAILGDFPMVLFDLKHNFYHLMTLIQYTKDTLKGTSDAGFNYYYLLPLWPIFAIFGAKVILKLFKFNKFSGAILLGVFIILNLTSKRIDMNFPTGMPLGLNISSISEASRLIAKDANSEFNVTEVLDFDKRAYVLRYYLEFVYHKKPLSEIEYENLDSLYVLAQKDYDFKKSNIWEVKAAGLNNINLLSDVGNGYAVYRLTE
jgi:hypothetical protein